MRETNDNLELKTAYSKLKAPEQLKKETLEKVLKANHKKTFQNAEKHTPIAIVTPICAAILAASFLLFSLSPSRIQYITPMEPGTYYEQVELKDGMLIFAKNRATIDISPNAGLAIGVDNDGSVQLGEVGKQLVSKKLSNGGQLFYSETTSDFVSDMDVTDASYIGEQKIYIYNQSSQYDTEYKAVFEKNNKAFEVIGIEVTQKEYIDFLYDCIKNK